jgi:hypothetical protein
METYTPGDEHSDRTLRKLSHDLVRAQSDLTLLEKDKCLKAGIGQAPVVPHHNIVEVVFPKSRFPKVHPSK